MKQHVQDGVKIYEYSQDEGDFHAENIKIENGGITFDFISPIENLGTSRLIGTRSRIHII